MILSSIEAYQSIAADILLDDPLQTRQPRCLLLAALEIRVRRANGSGDCVESEAFRLGGELQNWTYKTARSSLTSRSGVWSGNIPSL